ncbi:MAG TPA: 16S rRNA (cytidine(1402)-2'-O)-methyltransferase [Candidatus Desulfofervidus auxilii]|uniref:Ribosomal RNA small subunit methyltransferase I n=1 Tax=Desulfofervidus auxilii TaxID=1621989 RepID=A0A7C0U383_DESA2|nr:16S rRNA (cytidine(1402)-2'-O)-methyltransferase [Candidatus Desulfofervidus auxilii]
MHSLSKSGILYIVATPIGNLEDITLRALKVLKEVNLIAAEDTRHTKKLLNFYNIKTRIISYREQNREKQGKKILKLLKEGKNVALVSDAGTPCISDPGVHLVDLALKEGIKVVPIPGPSALVAALSIAGVPIHPFLFLGFLPQKEGKKRKLFESLKNLHYTIVFFESPHRLKKTLKLLEEIYPESKIVIAREVTKFHEEIIRGKIKEIQEKLKEIKGEITIILARTASISGRKIN